MNELKGIAAVILAAGSSTRMGQPKLLLPWKDKTVIWEVISTLAVSGIREINIVIQKKQDELFDHLQLLSLDYPLRIIFNISFHCEDMLTSIQLGLNGVSSSFDAALITLGDQPFLHEKVVRMVAAKYMESNPDIIIPSHQVHRGHPWLIARRMWSQFLDLKFPLTPRDFLIANEHKIMYIPVEDPYILLDIDTPEDYEKYRPEN